MNSITNNINKLFIIQVISFLLIIVSYKYFIATRWTYIGLTWNFSYIKLVESILFIIITNKILPSYNNKPSYFFLNIQFLMPILPMLALYSCSDKPRIYIYMVMSAYYLLICLVKIISRFIDKNDFMPTTLSGYNYKFVNSTMVGLIIAYLVSLMIFNGFEYLNFNIHDVYLYRKIFASNLPKYYSYLTPLTISILLPTSIYLSLLDGKKILISLLFLLSALIFAYTQHKTTLIYPFAIFFIYQILRKQNPVMEISKYYLGTIIICIGIYISDIKSLFIISSIFFRRLLIIPAEINFIYYDFFSKNSHVFWSDKFWTFNMIDYMYDYKYQNLIGMNYFFHNNNNWVNTGWIGTSYMHANYIGLIVYAIIIAIIFSYLDYIAKKKEAKFTILLTFIPIMILFILSDLSTVIINHGLLIAFILLLLISPSNTKKY